MCTHFYIVKNSKVHQLFIEQIFHNDKVEVTPLTSRSVEECTIYMKDLTAQEGANVHYNIVNFTFLHVMSKRIISFLPIIRILMQ
jgi:hypothetical protein